MKLLHATLIGAGLAGVLALSARAVQAAGQEKKAAPQEAAMAPVKPTAEHQALQKWVGTWDATVTSMGQTTKGVSVVKPVGQLWIVCDFKGEMMGQPFEGHDIMGYNPDTKKFTEVWVDNMGATATIGEGTMDASGKKMTMNLVGSYEGEKVNHTSVTEWKDDNTAVFTMSGEMPDGKVGEMLKIEYKRRK